MKNFILTSALIICAVTNGFAQHNNAFQDFIFQNFRKPDDLKDECKWIYTFVKVRLDSQKKITNYECMNTADTNFPSNMQLNKSFEFLIGYQFNDYKKKSNSLIFYFSIANLDECFIKPEKIVPAPENMLTILLDLMEVEKKKDPKVDFYEKPVIVYPFHRIR